MVRKTAAKGGRMSIAIPIFVRIEYTYTEFIEKHDVSVTGTCNGLL
jgi:hypothetical protein